MDKSIYILSKLDLQDRNKQLLQYDPLSINLSNFGKKNKEQKKLILEKPMLLRHDSVKIITVLVSSISVVCNSKLRFFIPNDVS